MVAGIAAALALAAPAGAKQTGFDRAADPVVLTGSQLPRLLGSSPDRIAAFRFKPRKGKCRSKRCSPGKWVRVPVQVDERARVDFGDAPGGNMTPPSGDATVYGGSPIGVTELQYTDPGTFVGPDPDPALDGDDELALMASDLGPRAPKRMRAPRNVKRGGASALTVSDPLSAARERVYLFRATAKLKPAKADYVHYAFKLASGEYKATYKRGDGPNPESSTVSTPSYRAGYSDRWFLDTLAIDAGAADGRDILDGFKTGFAPGDCTRSEATFNDAEGAFVANLDGPVRAIRSFVGANSGPLTERTDVFYRDRQETRIDLRVHAISALLPYTDLSTAAAGMTYRSSVSPGGVAVDGVPDSVSGTPAAWHLWSGPQGSLFASTAIRSGFDAQIAAGINTGFYQDRLNTPLTQCWGDAHLVGAAGTHMNPAGGLPNTDPRSSPFSFMSAVQTRYLTAPGAGAADAAGWLGRTDAPLTASASSYAPKR